MFANVQYAMAISPSNAAPSRNTVVQAQQCDCEKDLDELIAKVKDTYAGYELKTRGKEGKRLAELTKRLREKAKGADPSTCNKILEAWIAFFRDGHMQVGVEPQAGTAETPPAASPKPSLEVIGSDILVLKIPTFNDSKTDIEAVLEANKGALSTAQTLIIDLQGNDGGSDWSYNNLLPLLYTQPIITVPGGIRASEESVKYYSRFVNKDHPENTPAWVTDFLTKAKVRMGQIISNDQPDKLVLDGPLPFPKNVAILIDKTNTSSAETFILKARQSHKVTLFGSKTGGIVDYLNPTYISLSCKNHYVTIPTVVRSKKLPEDSIDNKGIAPNVVIDPEKVKDRVSFVVEYYKKRQ